MPLRVASTKYTECCTEYRGLLDEQYIDLSTQIHSELDIELLKENTIRFSGILPF